MTATSFSSGQGVSQDADASPEASTKPLKLWRVSFEFEYLALAADEYEARQFLQEALNDETPIVADDVAEWNGVYPSEWDSNCLVYHNMEGDITVPQAIATHHYGIRKQSASAPSHEAQSE